MKKTGGLAMLLVGIIFGVAGCDGRGSNARGKGLTLNLGQGQKMVTL